MTTALKRDSDNAEIRKYTADAWSAPAAGDRIFGIDQDSHGASSLDMQL